MSHVTIDINSQLAAKLNSLIQSFGSKDLMFGRFIKFHQDKLKREIASMQFDLNRYEQQYGMKSSDFYKKFESGELGDINDYMLWAGIYQMQLESKAKLEKLL